MVVAGGLEFLGFGAGAKEQNLFGPLDLADLEKVHAVEVGPKLRDLGRRDGEEQLVVFATMQSELQGVPLMRATRAANAGDGNPLRPNPCADSAGAAEASNVGREAITQIDERTRQVLAGKELAQANLGLGVAMCAKGGRGPSCPASAARFEEAQAKCRKAEAPTNEDLVTWPGARAPQRFPLPHLSDNDHIDDCGAWNDCGVTSDHGYVVAPGETGDASEKTLDPGSEESRESANDTSANRGVPPIAATSLSARARARWPTDAAG